MRLPKFRIPVEKEILGNWSDEGERDEQLKAMPQDFWKIKKMQT